MVGHLRELQTGPLQKKVPVLRAWLCRRAQHLSVVRAADGDHRTNAGRLLRLLRLVFARHVASMLASAFGFLAIVFLAIRAFEYWRHRTPHPLKFDEPPEPATQWLGLSG
jgi:hypothetical protein